MSDRMMSRILERMDSVRQEMEASNVFRQEDVHREEARQARLAKTKKKVMPAIIGSLEQTILDMDNKARHYRQAHDGHRRVLTLLEELAGQHTKTDSAHKVLDALQRIRDMMNRGEPLAQMERDKSEMDQKHLDRYAELAQQAKNVAEALEREPAGKLVQAAADDFRKMDAEAALKKLPEAADMLQKALDEARSRLSDIQQQQQELQELQDALQRHIADAKAQEKSPNAEKAMESIMAMDGTRKALENQQMKEAAENVQQAQQQMADQQPAEARKNLEAAHEQVAQQQQQLARQLEDMMQQKAEQMARADQINALSEELSSLMKEHEQMAAESASRKAPQSSAEALAQKMKGLGQQMEKSELPEPAQQMKKATQSTQQQKHPQAQQAMNMAMQQLQEAMEQLQGNTEPVPSEMPNENANDQMVPQGSHEIYAGGAVDEQLGEERDGRSWRERLPERERKALLSARQERFTPTMEESVRKYFEELARTR
jgi:hypothetical protein